MSLDHSELEALSATNIQDAIPDESLAAALASPPFLPGPLFNVRDIGLVHGSALSPGRFFRSGMLKDDEDTVAWLASRVARIVDLRGERERQRNPDPAPEGVESVWFPPQGTHPARLKIEDFVDGDGSQGWRKVYLDIVRDYQPTIRAVLEHVRDRPQEPILFHCTAGRDRTGVVAGMLHHLAGSPSDTITTDYMLTRIGIEPVRDMLEGYLRAGLPGVDRDTPGFENMASLRATSWQAFIEGMEEEFGGWDGYIAKLGFGDDEVAVIRANLRK